MMKLLVTAAVCGAFVAPPLPGDLRIPEQRFDLRDFGAKGDGSSLNTGAFEAAVAAIRSAGGGQLYVPPGTWVTTGFALASHMSLFLESGATIRGLANFSRDAASNKTVAAHWRPRNDSCSSYPAKGTHTPWDGQVDERHSGYEPLIGGWNVTDVLVTGNNGTIDGQAGEWWPYSSPYYAKGRLSHGRPHALFFSRSQRVVVANLTVRDSAFWSVRFWASAGLRAANLTITAPRGVYNNDGIDLDSSSGARVENLYYDGGDDGVALKSGLAEEGARFNLATRDVEVRNITVRTRASCTCVGSEVEGGVVNVSMEFIDCRDSADGIRFKTPRPSTVSGRVWPATQLSYSHVRLDNITGPLDPTTHKPLYGWDGIGLWINGFQDVRISDVNGTAVQNPGIFERGSNLVLTGVQLKSDQPPPLGAFHCGANLTGRASSDVSPAPCFKN